MRDFLDGFFFVFWVVCYMCIYDHPLYFTMMARMS